MKDAEKNLFVETFLFVYFIDELFLYKIIAPIITDIDWNWKQVDFIFIIGNLHKIVRL